MRNKQTLDIIGLPAIANSKSMINGNLEPVDVAFDYQCLVLCLEWFHQ